MDDYIAKPIKGDVLAGMLGKWLPARDAPPESPRVVDGAPTRGKDPQEPPGLAAESALDMDVLAQLAELMGEGLGDLIRTYLADTPAQLAAIASAIGEGDHAVISRCAHSIKSSSYSVGTMMVGKVAAALEQLAREKGAMSEAERLLAALRTACIPARARLEQIASGEEAHARQRGADSQGGVSRFIKDVVSRR